MKEVKSEGSDSFQECSGEIWTAAGSTLFRREKKRTGDSTSIAVTPFEWTIPIFVSQRLWSRCQDPQRGSGLGRKQLLLSLYLCICLPVFRRFIYFPAFGCTGSTQVQTTLSPVIHSETGVTGSHSVYWPNGAVCPCSPSTALALMHSLSFFISYFHSPELPFTQNNKELAVYSTIMTSKDDNN